MAGLRVDRFSLSFSFFRSMRIAIFRARGLFSSFSPLIPQVLALPRSHTFFAYNRKTRCYHACPNNSVHIHSIRRRLPVGKSEKKNDLWICDISWSPSRPRPTVLLNPKPFLALISPLSPYFSLTSFFSFLLALSRHVDLDLVLSLASSILHPTDHSYDSYLVWTSRRSRTK